MFESLDENAPSRMPPAGPARKQMFTRIRPVLWMLMSISAYMTRPTNPDSVRRMTGLVILAVGAIFYGASQYRAYRDTKDGPTDLKL